MKLRNILLIIGLLFNNLIFAQVNNVVEDIYFDFSKAVAEARYNDAFKLSKLVLKDFEKLNPKMQIGFNMRYAKLEDEQGDRNIAIGYYQKVVDAMPNYYVARAALGHGYLSSLNPIIENMNAVKNDQVKYKTYQNQYKEILNKAIKNLEIAYACDPYLDLEKLLTNLYLRAGIKKSINTLKNSKTDCQDIISDF